MIVLKRTLLWIAAASFTGLLFLTAMTASLSATFQAEKTKKLLNDSGTYEGIVDSILAAGKTELEKSGEATLPLDDPKIQEIANQAFSPQVLRQHSETLVDALYAWLEGDTQKPEFSLDLTASKSQLIDGLGMYAKERYVTLPDCTTAPSEEVDVLTTECKLPGVNVDAEVTRFVNELKTSKEFLPDPVITADTFKSEEEGKETSVFERAGQVPETFRLLQKTPFIFGLLTLVTAVVIIFTSSHVLRGVQRTATSMIFVGLTLIVTSLIALWLLNKYSSALEPGEELDALRDPLVAIGNSITRSITTMSMIFGSIYAGIGVVTLGTLFVLKRREHPLGYQKAALRHEPTSNAITPAPAPQEKKL